MAPDATTPFTFLPSTQPEVVRAFDKDTYYAAHYVRALRDALRTLFGPQVLAAPGRGETIAALGTAAYMLLSTASADMTAPSRAAAAPSVGEEYVGALAVNQVVQPASRRRRALWALAQSLVPFFTLRAYGALTRRADLLIMRRTQALARARARWAARLPTPQRMEAFALAARPDDPATDVFSRDAQAILETLPQNGTPPAPTDRILRILVRLRALLPLTSSVESFAAQLGAVHLALFYLNGRYYTWGQRIWGVRFVSAASIGRHPRPGERAPSYAVLGVLLLIQLAVKMLRAVPLARLLRTAARRTGLLCAQKDDDPLSAAEKGGDATVIAIEGERYTIQHGAAVLLGPSHAGTETLLALEAEAEEEAEAGAGETGEGNNNVETRAGQDAVPVVPLSFPDPAGAMWPLSESAYLEEDEAGQAAAEARARDLAQGAEETLRCTLCMDRRAPQVGTSAVLECGHVFDWECIVGWAREKAECPLCRQAVAPQRIWPVYNL